MSYPLNSAHGIPTHCMLQHEYTYGCYYPSHLPKLLKTERVLSTNVHPVLLCLIHKIVTQQGASFTTFWKQAF
jgi:hypothetical protein